MVSRIAGLLPAMPSIGTSRSAAERRRLTSRLQGQVLDRAADGDRERVDLHRLGDEVVRAGANRGDRGVEPALAGQHDRQQVGIALAELLAQLDAGDPGHLDVGDDDVGGRRAQVLQRSLARGHGIDIEAALPERVPQQDSSVFIVVDDQDGSVHLEVIPFCRDHVHRWT